MHGRSDLVTPYGVSRYLLDQLRPVGAPERVQLTTYRGGHMFYLSDEQRRVYGRCQNVLSRRALTVVNYRAELS